MTSMRTRLIATALKSEDSANEAITEKAIVVSSFEQDVHEYAVLHGDVDLTRWVIHSEDINS